MTFIKTIKHDDNLDITGKRTYSQYASAGSVMGYAASNGDDPIAAYNKTVARNEEINAGESAKYHQDSIRPLVWISLSATCISASPQPKVNRIKLALGDEVKFEGNIYKITPENNDNFGLEFQRVYDRETEYKRMQDVS